MPKDFSEKEDLDGRQLDLGAPFGKCSVDRLPNGTYAISSLDEGVGVAENVKYDRMKKIIDTAEAGKLGNANAMMFFAPS